MNRSSVHDDTHSDYQAVKADAAAQMRRGVWTNRFPQRFVPFAERRLASDLSQEAIATISEGKHYISYRGVPMAKDPFDMVLYELLFYELQPRTIIELGAYTGASAWWMADTLETLELDARVYAVDIDLSLIDDAARTNPKVRFLAGDCHHIETVFPPSVLEDLPHPLIVIDDAHVNIAGVYRHFHQHAFRTGDYLIVEDTIPCIPGSFGQSDDDRLWGDWKWHEVHEFFAAHGSAYRVDRYYTDFFGYNGTWNWNGFIKRM